MPSHNEEVDWKMRPGGMLVQKWKNDVEGDVVTSSIGPLPFDKDQCISQLHFAQGLCPCSIHFWGQVKEDAECLHVGGVKDKSKMMILEDPSNRERRRRRRIMRFQKHVKQ